MAEDALNALGAKYTHERVVRRGKIITAAGVSSGIDMGLVLANEIAGPLMAQAIQLGIDAGALNQQDANILAQAVWLAIHGLTGGLICMGHYNKFPWVDRERLIEGQLDLLMRGMLAGS